MSERPPPRTYRSQVSVEQVTRHLYLIRAVPYPLHTAQVSAYIHRGHVASWSVTMLTTPDAMRHPGLGLMEALSLAGELVGTLTGETLKKRFHGIQRTAMGQGRCPYLGKSLCQRPPTPGSVWCEVHPNGRKVVNDVSG